MRHLEGLKFNKLFVLKKAGASRHGEIIWECLCECGNIKTYSTDHLTRKNKPVLSCGCIRNKKGMNHKDWKGCGEISGAWWTAHVNRANDLRKNPVEISLTIKEAWELFLKQNRKCALSGLPLEFSYKGCHNTASLDRIDSSKGYEFNNVQWVHKHINFMKRIYDQEYFIEMCKKVAEYNAIQKEKNICGI
jgi:hypothetical protein